MLNCNQLIQDAYESIGMAGLGESVAESGDDNLNVVGVKELNRLITQLNNENYLSMSQQWVDGPQARVCLYRLWWRFWQQRRFRRAGVQQCCEKIQQQQGELLVKQKGLVKLCKVFFVFENALKCEPC